MPPCRERDYQREGERENSQTYFKKEMDVLKYVERGTPREGEREREGGGESDNQVDRHNESVQRGTPRERKRERISR